MKPTMDLKDPRVKLGIEIYQNQIQKALECTLDVERSVVPIYWTLETETKPEQIGSGTIVQLGGEYFVFSASHVFDEIKQFQLLIGVGVNGGALPHKDGE